MPQAMPPVVGPDDEFFWDGVKEHKLLIRRCAGCKMLRHPPSPMCPNCHGRSWETQEASGKGTVYSWVMAHHTRGEDPDPRLVAIVQLEEGVRIVSNLQGIDIAAVWAGMPVAVSFEEVDGVLLHQFRPAGKA